MYQIITKAININTREVLYEGVKKEYETYLQAARDLKRAALYPQGKMYKECSSYRIPENYDNNIHAYASWNHLGNIRTTLYIKKMETN